MTLRNILSGVGQGVNDLYNSAASLTGQDFAQTGAIPSADNTGLPSSKVQNERYGTKLRKTISWFVPEIGIVNMYINPQNIRYSDSKIIQKERTKGGYVLQYWGEELTTLDIDGTTGSSGIEGVNVLYEIYRSEQFVFDNLGLTMGSINSAQNIGNYITQKFSGNGFGELASGTLGLNNNTQFILPRNIPSLANLAFTTEMYYNGWIFRGYFNTFRITESVSNLGMFDYNIQFTATQRRGYRVNEFPWQKSAKDGSSNWGTENTFGNPMSYGTYPDMVKPTQVSASGQIGGVISPLSNNPQTRLK